MTSQKTGADAPSNGHPQNADARNRASAPSVPVADKRQEASRSPADPSAAGMDLRKGEGGNAPQNSGMATGDGQQPRKRRRRRRRRKSVHANVPLDGVVAPAVKPVANPPHQPARTNAQPVRSARRPYNGPPNAYAALDLGTNNCRLLVAIPTRYGQFRVVDAFSRIVRLGEGLGSTNQLSQAAMDRAVEALKACGAKLHDRPVKRMRLIATEACRAATNGADFLERVHQETGLQLEMIDRETEARLAVAGCASLVERGTDAVVLFDIGGGSSEIALMDLADRKSKLTDNIVDWTSLPVGVVTLAERFEGRDVTPQIFADMKAYTADLLHKFKQRNPLDTMVNTDRFALLGTSGTVTTLAGIHLGLQRYDRRRVDGLWLSDDQVTTINDRLLGWSYDERVANPCIGPDRADLVLAGCAILEAIREAWPSKRLRVADRGLREGLLTEMMSSDGAWNNNRGPRGRNRYRARERTNQ